jgi:hypothetical protein
VGGATQHNLNAVTESQNSQDSLSIIVRKQAIAAVVTDGCTGTHEKLEASSRSANEVGAKLLAYVVSNAALRLALTHTRLPAERFVWKLSDVIGRKLLAMIRTFAGTDAVTQRVFAFDFLMSTILGFVVTDRRFIVFHSGDGIIAVNGETRDLDDQAGTYLTNELISRTEAGRAPPSIKLLSSGPTGALNSILLATDGLARLANDHRNELTEFETATPPAHQVRNGVDFLLQEFRQRLAWNPDVDLKLDDDATFALLRRTGEEVAGHDYPL